MMLLVFILCLSALLSARTLGLQLLGGIALRNLKGFARLRKRLRILALSRAAGV